MKRLCSTCGGMAAALLVGLLAALPPLQAEDPFAKTLGDVAVADVKKTDILETPFLFWGGDVATFLANGDLETQKGSIFDKQGLKLKLKPGDDFAAQVKSYLAGDSPFLRGTMSQLGQASEVLGKDPRTQPVVFLQLTWSAGDHMVGRPSVKTANDLKGKKIALQAFGPHVGMLDDVLHLASLKWGDITVVWTKDVTGKDGPAELFRKDPSIDACFVVTPDMMDLTGGPDKTGDGGDKTVKGARVVVSTKSLSRSIADVYACRKDFYDKHKDVVEKFAAGYLKGCEDLVDLKKNHDLQDKADKGVEAKYAAVLKLTQKIYGKDAIGGPDDADGLISDATFVGLPGNVKFFTDKTDKTAFQGMMKTAVDMAVSQGWAKVRTELGNADLNYDNVKTVGGLTQPTVVKPSEGGGIIDVEKVDFTKMDLDKDTIASFTILFDADDPNFDTSKYAKDFQKVVEDSAKLGHALFAVRGHVDPTKTLGQVVAAGIELKKITRTGSPGAYKYFLKDGTEIDLTDTKKVLALIDKEDFSGSDANPKPTMQAALKLSEKRAEAVRNAIVAFAKSKDLQLDATQFKSAGVGIAEPVKPKPKNEDEAALNRRVEFRILKVSPELVKKKDFDF